MAINVYKHVDNASAGGGDGSSWALSGGTAAYTEAELEAFLEGTVVAGDVIFIKGGTNLVLDSAYDFSARDGTAISPIALIGVKATTTNVGANVVYTDWASGTARPFFDMATYSFQPGDYVKLYNLRFQGDAANTLTLNLVNECFNCSFNQDYGSSVNRNLIFANGIGVRFVECDFTSQYAKGVLTSTYTRFYNCRFYDFTDATNGIAIAQNSSAPYFIIDSCIFDTIKNTAISLVSADYTSIKNCTFYDCATDIGATDAFGHISINNVHEATDTDAYKWTTPTDSNSFFNIHGNDTRCTDMWDGVDETTVYKCNDVSTGDPLFNNAETGDFSLGAGSPCIDTGLGLP